MNEEVDGDARPVDTLMIRCPVCGSDSGDTLGVTGAMGQSLASTVIMRCDTCAAVYLSPPPTIGRGKDGLNSRVIQMYSRLIQRQKRGVPANCRFLCVNVTEELRLQHSAGTGHFDLILLPLSLEGAEDPSTLLVDIAKLLDRNGEIDILVSNTGSSCFRVFCGRHWFGYRFPTARQLFDVSAIHKLANKAGLGIKSKRTLFAADGWLLSTSNWLVDWQVRPAYVALLTGGWGLPWFVASIFESLAAMRGKAAVLAVRLGKQ